jgi:hypothetical protein
VLGNLFSENASTIIANMKHSRKWNVFMEKRRTNVIWPVRFNPVEPWKNKRQSQIVQLHPFAFVNRIVTLV